ncbi:hypothetical protein QTP88_024925 [Uroleucon formosanum]
MPHQNVGERCLDAPGDVSSPPHLLVHCYSLYLACSPAAGGGGDGSGGDGGEHQQTNGGVVTNGGTVTATTLTGLNGSTAMIARECANCGKRITERFLLKALDLFWHEDCLKCGCCDCRLGEVGSTLYTKANLILCKRDYLRGLRRMGAECVGGETPIPDSIKSVYETRRRLLNLIKTVCRPKRRCLARHKSQLSAADGKHNLHKWGRPTVLLLLYIHTTTPLTIPTHTDARYALPGVWTRLRHLENFSLMNGHGQCVVVVAFGRPNSFDERISRDRPSRQEYNNKTFRPEIDSFFYYSFYNMIFIVIRSDRQLRGVQQGNTGVRDGDEGQKQRLPLRVFRVSTVFCVGDRFYLCENKILCEYDYEERLVFANMATYNSSSLAHIRRQVSRLQQPAANEHAHAAAATAGDVVGPTDEVDRCRATSVEQHQQQQQRRPLPPYDTAAIGYSGATASPASGQQQQQLQQQQQHQQHHVQQHQHMQQHHQFLSTAAGATVLSAHQSTVVVGGGGGGGGGGGRVDDGSSGYGSPDSETGIEPSTAAAAAAAAAAANIGGAIIASSATAAPPVQ